MKSSDPRSEWPDDVCWVCGYARDDTFENKQRQRICPDCVEEDLARFRDAVRRGEA